MDVRWTGNAAAGDKTAWDNVGNWADYATNAAVANYPGDTALRFDNVYFDTALSSGALSPAGFSTPLTECLGSIFIGGTYNGTIGGASDPVTIRTYGNAGVMIDAPNAGLISLSGELAASGLYPLTVLSGSNIILGGRISDSRLLGGTVTLGTSTAFVSAANVYCGYVQSVGADLQLTILAGAVLPTWLRMFGGNVTCNTQTGLLSLSNGTFTFSGPGLDDLEQTGGKFIYQAGGIGGIAVFAGEFDGSQSIQPRNIGFAIIGPGATVNLDCTSRNITLTDGLENLGGSVRWPKGYRLNKV